MADGALRSTMTHGWEVNGLVVLALAGLVPACASGGSPACTGRACVDLDGGHAAEDGGGLGIDGGRSDGGSSDGGARDGGSDARSADAGTARCPAGEAIVGRSDGAPLCAPIADAVAAYVNASCSIYLGWRDSCGACSDPPAKWGRVSGASCDSSGGESTCESVTLGGTTLRMHGLNFDGDVDDNDKLYVGFRCDAAAGGGPSGDACPAGHFVTGVDGSGALVCAPIGAVAEAAIHEGCSLTLGARDECDGCTGAPTEWGRVGGDDCAIGAGTGGTCSVAALGGRDVTLYGLDLDGDVNDDDQIYLGLACSGATSSETRVLGACPPGTIATGLGGDGSIVCTSPAPAIETTVESGCVVYLGWRDSCDGCSLGPAKWGRANGAGTCENGAGADFTCATSPTTLFGINTDGDVDGDDKLYVGMHCTAP